MAPDGSAFPLRTALRDERAAALDHGFELLREAWQSFDAPRAMQPPISPAIQQLALTPLPSAGVGVRSALDLAAHVLDESLAHARPR